LSSILKALKKIEESAPPEESLNTAQALNPRTVFGQRHRGRWLTSKTIYMGLAAVVVLAAGILIRGWMSGEADPRGDRGPLVVAPRGPNDLASDHTIGDQAVGPAERPGEPLHRA